MTRTTVRDKLAKYEKNPDFRAKVAQYKPELEMIKLMVEIRQKTGLSQRELAERMGKPQSTIARIESGQASPNVRTLFDLARATGKTLQVRLV